MPIAPVKILEGCSAEQKRQLVKIDSSAMAESLGMPNDNVRVLLDEYPGGHRNNSGRLSVDSQLREARVLAPSAWQLAEATTKLLSN